MKFNIYSPKIYIKIESNFNYSFFYGNDVKVFYLSNSIHLDR